jgi:periplasmic copper chaperone A
MRYTQAGVAHHGEVVTMSRSFKFNATYFIAACAVFSWAGSSFAHVTLEQGAALAGTYYKANLRLGHGCEGTATHTVRVLIPAGFQGAKPMPKMGWTLNVQKTKLAKPYDDHGRQVTEDVSEITWVANSKEAMLPDAHYDEFALRGKLPAQEGPLWFKVEQLCEKGKHTWTELPTSGSSTKGLKSPAALLEVLPAGQAHAH